MLLEMGEVFGLTYFPRQRGIHKHNKQKNMIFTLKRIRNGKSIDQDGKMVDRGSWSGHSTYPFCTVTIVPEVGRDGRPVTGLTPAKARELEEALFYDRGYLDPKSKYWTTADDRFAIPFPPNGISLNDENPEDRLKIAVLSSMKKVAVGRDQLKKKSKAEYILTSQEKIEEEDDSKYSVKEEAYGLLSDANSIKLKQIYSVLAKQKKGGTIVDTASMTDLAIKNGLRKAIEANAAFFNEIAGDPKLNIKAEIIELVTKRIISTTNSGYFRGKDQLAYDLDSMVNYMEDPHNQSMVIQFKQELKGLEAKKTKKQTEE